MNTNSETMGDFRRAAYRGRRLAFTSRHGRRRIGREGPVQQGLRDQRLSGTFAAGRVAVTKSARQKCRAARKTRRKCHGAPWPHSQVPARCPLVQNTVCLSPAIHVCQGISTETLKKWCAELVGAQSALSVRFVFPRTM